jgi:hypothetical protein
MTSVFDGIEKDPHPEEACGARRLEGRTRPIQPIAAFPISSVAAMSGFDRRQAIAALIALVTALFVAAGAVPGLRWRRPLRVAAIIGFAIAVAVVLVDIALWLTGPNR